ncbi:MAG: BREX-3 system phosphatase PglZ [Magnetococcales bacterium]|nr:BREX-3 system phosphatase PglZ [Magnetococcales bacterium]
MVDWRETILKEFTPQVARLTLVADPDGLLVEEGILQTIHDRGFELMRYEDPVAFRFAFESKFRSRWDQGEQIDLVVTLASDSNVLPHDLLQTSRRLSFNLADLFPGLSYPVLAALDRSEIGTLYQALARHAGEPMGDNATKDFILRHVFGIAPELIRQPSDLLRVLLRRHYQDQRIPGILDDRLVGQLQQSGWFDEWPLGEIVPDRDAFFGFLQERWPVFLNRLLERLEGNPWMSPDEHVSSYGMKHRGPAILPFDHDDVRIYVDNLFLEGMLQPVSVEKSRLLKLNWVEVGVFSDPEADRKRRLEGLLEKCDSTLPEADGRHREWIQYARLWGQLTRMANDPERPLTSEHQESFIALRQRVDATFQSWMTQRFGGLHNQPPSPPVMVHHIPRAMARKLEGDGNGKIVLIVMDGLALDQWFTLKEVLTEQSPDFNFHEDGVFAWVPTLTSVSRQAIFSGKAPLFFPTTIQTTRQEPALWQQFWEGQGLAAHETAYLKGLGDGSLDEVEEALSDHRVRAAGLVVDKVDKIMHGMELGSAGMHASVRQWARNGFMTKLLELCHVHGFEIYLTSDHGNVEALGCGRPTEGVIADVRGERCRIYPEKELRTSIHGKFAESLEWPDHGLPEGFHSLLSTRRSAFIGKGSRIVGHGGISMEEVIVPVVQISVARK